MFQELECGSFGGREHFSAYLTHNEVIFIFYVEVKYSKKQMDLSLTPGSSWESTHL